MLGRAMDAGVSAATSGATAGASVVCGLASAVTAAALCNSAFGGVGFGSMEESELFGAGETEAFTTGSASAGFESLTGDGLVSSARAGTVCFGAAEAVMLVVGAGAGVFATDSAGLDFISSAGAAALLRDSGRGVVLSTGAAEAVGMAEFFTTGSGAREGFDVLDSEARLGAMASEAFGFEGPPDGAGDTFAAGAGFKLACVGFAL